MERQPHRKRRAATEEWQETHGRLARPVAAKLLRVSPMKASPINDPTHADALPAIPPRPLGPPRPALPPRPWEGGGGGGGGSDGDLRAEPVQPKSAPSDVGGHDL